jgi:dienelactone hydrolase
MRKVSNKSSIILLLLVFATVSFSSAQERIPFEMKPVGDEAFGMILQSYEYDKDMPLDARTVETVKIGGHTREKIVFNGVRDNRVPGYLAIPDNGEGPYPCVILLHGFTGNKAEWWQDDSFYAGGLVAKEFLGAGFAVLALDAQYHGERAPANDYEKPNAMKDRGWTSRSVEMIIQTVTEYRRAIDYLENRTDIDSSRIGVHGYSMGGMMAFLLTGSEPRVKAAVSCVTWNWDTDDAKYELIAPHNFARAIGERPFLVMLGREDEILPLDAAKRLYGLVEGPATKLIFYDSGHRLDDDYIKQTGQWFTDHLK